MTRSRAGRNRWCLLLLLVLVPAASDAGGLAFLDSEDGVQDASKIAMSSDGTSIYSIDPQGNSEELSLFSRNPATGALTLVETYTDGVDGDGFAQPTSVTVSPDGKNVYVTGRMQDSVAVFSRDLGTGELTFVEMRADGDSGAPGVPSGTMGRPSSVIVSPSPNEEHVYVASDADNSITLFTRNSTPGPTYGALTYVGMLQNDCPTVCGLHRPEALAVAPDGLSVYVAAHTASTGAVSAFARDPGTGFLTFLEYEENNTNGIASLLNPVALAVTPDNGALYVTAQAGDAVHVFSRDTTPMSSDYGKIALVQVQQLGSNTGPNSVAIDPSNGGPFVYVAGNNAKSNALFVFRRDTGTNKIARLQTIHHSTISQPGGIVVGADGTFVHVSSAKVGTGTAGLVTFEVDVCGSGTRAIDEECDDGNVVDGDDCHSDCTIEACGAAPETGCTTIVHVTTAEDSSLDIKNDPLKADAKDAIKWQWKKGNTVAADFGDPRTTADYVICIYDSSGNPQPLISRAAPSGAWKRSPSKETDPTKGFSYTDKSLIPAGLSQFKLKAGLVDKAQLSVQGKADFLRPPTLPLVPPVKVEVRSTQNPGICWVATYGTNPAMFPKRMTYNTSARFKAKSD